MAHEKKGSLPPPHWLRKPFPKRVYGQTEIRRIVRVIRGEKAGDKFALETALEEDNIVVTPVVAEEDIIDLF